MQKSKRKKIIQASTDSTENFDKRYSGKKSSYSDSDYRKKRVKNNSKINKRKRIKTVTPHKTTGMIFSVIVLCVFCIYILINLFTLQVLEFDVHATESARYHYKKTVQHPSRGSIYDTNGKQFAFSTKVYTIGATPSDVNSRTNSKMTKEEIAEGISLALDMDQNNIFEIITDVDKSWVRIKRRVEKVMADSLREFLKEHSIGGISFDEEEKRIYPENTLAGTVLGFTSSDGIGQLGLEQYYNNELLGTPGYTYTETDNYGKLSALPFAVPVNLQATDGYNLITTIDINIQKIIEKELNKSVKSYNASEGGIAIVMDPYTGSILGMAGTSGFNPNNPTACPPELDSKKWEPTSEEGVKYLSKNIWRNRAISDNYEPGSTFKTITAAMAMELGKFKETEVMNDRPIKIADWVIDCHKKGGHGLETAKQAFWNSCNPIFVMLSQRVGILKFYDFVRSFGFFEATGIDLPGEGAGIFHKDPTEIDMACLAFGEQSTVTPIAIINAYAAFANGGSLMRPRIVKALTDSKGNIVREIGPETVREVVSEETAARIRTLLEGVVIYGTGSKGYIEGYHVGGKTSTSTRDDLNNDISFLSMAPISQPEICILVVLFAPDKEYARSGLAARTSAEMTEQILEYLTVTRDYTNDDISAINKPLKLSDLNGMTLAQAALELGDLNIDIIDPSGKMVDSTIIKHQFPISGTNLHKGGFVAVYAEKTPKELEVVVPDVRGKNINECMFAMTESGINIIIHDGCLGVAQEQEFEPGKTILYGSTMEVSFSELEECPAGDCTN